MARKLDAFPGDQTSGPRRYPWDDWTDGSAWEIRRGEDYAVVTENMRVNLHMKAEALLMKVRTKKVADEEGEGLVFQFFDPEAEEAKLKLSTIPRDELEAAMTCLYEDAMEIYERARQEVTIDRSDGRQQKYAAVRYRKQIQDGWEKQALVPAIARIVRKPTLGFGHLEKAERPDLMVETLVLNRKKPYHRLFTAKTIEVARDRMIERGFLS